jgi:hypothetical protein
LPDQSWAENRQLIAKIMLLPLITLVYPLFKLIAQLARAVADQWLVQGPVYLCSGRRVANYERLWHPQIPGLVATRGAPVGVTDDLIGSRRS